jgi:hypothetical protein
MRACILTTLLVMASGCAAGGGAAVIQATPHYPAPANLVLGRSAMQAWLAQLQPVRTGPAAAALGIRVDDVTYYSQVLYDQEAHYDRNGSVFSETHTLRSGVMLR